jgi:hypothetical protein
MQSPDQNVERNRQLLLDRSLVGLQKYGVTTERDDLTLNEWLQHLLEELLDAANYIQAAKNNAAPACPAEHMHKGMLLWILYHHQGAKSPIGQPIRRVLGIEPHAALTTEQVRYADTVARMAGAPDNLHAEPSAADTCPPTLGQTIHLGQPGATVEPCLMLGPADDEVACLLFTAPGTEVRLTWPTQTQALAVLAAATAEDCTEAGAQPVTCECGDSYPLSSHAAGFIEGRGHCANCAAGSGGMASLLGVSPAPVERAATDSDWQDEREEQSPELAAAIQAREEAISQVHGLRTQLRDLVAAAQPIISALAGPSHHIREMQATVKIDENNPIIVLAKLCAAYCKQREAQHHD